VTVATPEPVNLPTMTGGNAAGLAILGDWLTAANDARSLAQQLVHSFFVPQAYKPQGQNGVEIAVANATGAILLGQSLGLDPLTSLQQIYVVHGRPGMYSKMKVALAQREGHRIWEEEYTPERSTWAGQRKGSEDVVRITLTIEDAKRAGWTSNAAYAKTPADMLAARCSSRVVDRIAADALFGLRSIEDLDDEPEPAVTVARVDAKAILGGNLITGMVREAAASVALDRDQTHDVRETPAPEPASGPEPERAPDVPMCTDAQYRGINAWFKASGLREVNGEGQAAARTKVVNMLVADPQNGRPEVAKWSEMTAAEAQSVLDTLQANGFAIVAEALDWPAEQPSSEGPNHEQAAAQAEAEQTYQAEAEHDPTTEPGWGEQA
jgi:predicted Fe-S protein YdhL (DUF1289 family)